MDVPTTTEAISTTLTVVLLNGLIAGVAENQRIGRRVKLRSLYFEFQLFPNDQAAAAVVNTRSRILLVYDRQANGVAPVWADVVASTDVASTTTNGVNDHPNMSNKSRFTILRDWHFGLTYSTVSLAGAAGSQIAQQCQSVNMWDHHRVFIPLKGKLMQFNTGVAGTVADITAGSLFLMALGTEAAADAPKLFHLLPVFVLMIRPLR